MEPRTSHMLGKCLTYLWAIALVPQAAAITFCCVWDGTQDFAYSLGRQVPYHWGASPSLAVCLFFVCNNRTFYQFYSFLLELRYGLRILLFETEKMAHQLRAPTALAEDWSSVPSTRIRHLITAWNSNATGLNRHIYLWAHTIPQIHIVENKIN